MLDVLKRTALEAAHFDVGRLEMGSDNSSGRSLLNQTQVPGLLIACLPFAADLVLAIREPLFGEHLSFGI